MSEYLHGTSILVGSGYYVGGEIARTLRKGMTGVDVKALQQALVAAGFSVGTKGADGAFGNDTETAVRGFQESKGLKSVNGIADSATMTALNIAGPASSMTPVKQAGSGPAPAPSSSAPNPDGPFLTRKYGPFPVYGWACVAAALGLGVYIVLPSRPSIAG